MYLGKLVPPRYYEKTKEQLLIADGNVLQQQQQQQLQNSSCLYGVWGDLDVHNLIFTHTRHIERPVLMEMYCKLTINHQKPIFIILNIVAKIHSF